jgi:hypothetical protein
VEEARQAVMTLLRQPRDGAHQDRER